jgi:hypothetical protein
LLRSIDNHKEDANIEGKQILFAMDSVQNNKKDVEIKGTNGLFKNGIKCIKDLFKKPFIKNLKLAINFYAIYFYLT